MCLIKMMMNSKNASSVLVYMYNFADEFLYYIYECLVEYSLSSFQVDY